MNWRTWLRPVADFLLPPLCGYCGEGLDADRECARLCDECRWKLAPHIEFACDACGAPVGPHALRDDSCVHCKRDRFRFDRAVALGHYTGPLEKACLLGKTNNGHAVIVALAELLADRIGDAWPDETFSAVLPVPSHPWNRLRRPTEAARRISEVIASRLEVPLGTPLLRKVRVTKPQRELPPSRRRVNLYRAFRPGFGTRSLIEGGTFLLTDDVLTTGTTANECARVLKQAGAKRVLVAALARGTGERQIVPTTASEPMTDSWGDW